MAKVETGIMPFLGPGTWFRIVHPENEASCKAPLLCLHGGPGSTHNYFEVLDRIADEDRRPIVMYDQIGCGMSYLDGSSELWNAGTWLDELVALRQFLGLSECHILGQSWGGMLQIAYAVDRKPAGVKSYIISSGHSSSSLWAREGMRRVALLSPEHRAAIADAISNQNFSGGKYEEAVAEYMRIWCNLRDTTVVPECCARSKRTGKEAYLYGWGPNEFCPTGSLASFEYTDRLSEITIPSLIISGVSDLCSPLIAKTMADGIPDSKWILYENAGHMCFVDRNEDYCRDLISWMNSHDFPI